MDAQKVIHLIKSIQDGTLDREDAIEMLELFEEALGALRPHFKKFWLRIVLDGVRVSLRELREHLQEIEEE